MKSNHSLPSMSRSITLFTLQKSSNTTLFKKASSQSKPNASYHIKRHSNAALSELEAYAANVCQFLATPAYVATTYPIHDINNEAYGVLSKHMDAFKTNQQDPLTKEDTVINSKLLAAEKAQRILMQQLMTLLHFYDNTLKITPSTLQYAYYTFISVPPAQYKLREILANFRNKTTKFNGNDINMLSFYLTKCINYIKKTIEHHSSAIDFHNLAKERALLDEIKNSIECISNQPFMSDQEKISVEILEEFDKFIKKNRIDLDKVNDNTLTHTIFGVTRQISVTDLKNYRQLKGIATTQTAQFICKNVDNNNQNISKNGMIVDFAWAKANIASKLHTKEGYMELAFMLGKEPLKATQENIQYLPDTNEHDDIHLYYWPTKQRNTHSIMMDLIISMIQFENTQHYKHHPALETIANYIALGRHLIQTIIKTFPRSSFEILLEYISNINLHCRSFITGKSVKDIKQEDDIQSILAIANTLFSTLQHDSDNVMAQFEAYFHEKIMNNSNKNRFTEDDNAVYKSLATDPVVVFHKYKTCLKYILSNEQLYPCLAKLTVSSDSTITNPLNNNQPESLQKTLVNDEVARINEVLSTLVNMQDFSDFMTDHGQYALTMIKEECELLRKKYARKALGKEYFVPLMTELKKMGDQLDKDFDTLCRILNITFSNHTPDNRVEETNQTHSWSTSRSKA